jgi:hypothetical protein
MRNAVAVNFPSANSSRRWRRRKPLPAPYLLSADLPGLRSAGFQTSCIADFQVGSPALWPVGLATRDTADLEVCATRNSYPASAGADPAGGTAKNPSKTPFGTLPNEGLRKAAEGYGR